MFLFGLAGLAEGAIGFGLFLTLLSLLIAGGIAIPGIWMRSRGFAYSAAVLFVGISLFFMPWYGFFPMESDDPDMISLLSGYRMNAYVWLFVGMVVLGSIARAYRAPTLDAEGIRFLD